MRFRTVKWKMPDGSVDVKKVGLYKGQTICTACESVVDSDGNKLDGPGCTKCDPDKAISPLTQRDLMTKGEIGRMLVMEDEMIDGIDEIDPDFIEFSTKSAELELKDEIDDEFVECIRQIEHHEFMLKLDPVKDSDVYKTLDIAQYVCKHSGCAL